MKSQLPQLRADRMAVRLLRELWQASVNTRFEYQTALGFVKDSHVRRVISDFVEIREVFIRELRGAIMRFNIPVQRPPVRFASRLRSIRTELSTAIAAEPDLAVLHEIERMEMADLDIYDAVMAESDVLPLSMVEMVRHQRERIRAEVARVQSNEVLHDTWS